MKAWLVNNFLLRASKMSLEPQVSKLSHCQRNINNRCQSLCSEYNNGYIIANDLKSQFVKLNRNKKKTTRKGCGHSQITTNHFSRRNSAATTVSTGSSTNALKSVSEANFPLTTTAATNNMLINKFYNRRIHSLKSWSMSHLKTGDEVSNINKKIRNSYDLTEQRCNYERVIHRQQQLQQQRPGPSEQVIRCNASNSRIPTSSVDQHRTQHDLKTTVWSDAISAKFLALSEFRMQNSKDCFSDSHHRLRLLRAQTPPYNSTIISETPLATTDCSETQPHELNWSYNDMDDVNSSKLLKDNENIAKSLGSSLSSLSLASLTPMPYAARQRILREQLAKGFHHRKTIMAGINKSAALSYQSQY